MTPMAIKHDSSTRIEWPLAGWIRLLTVRATVRANDASWPHSVRQRPAQVDPQLPFDPTRGLWPVANWNGHSRGISAGKSSAIADVQVMALIGRLDGTSGRSHLRSRKRRVRTVQSKFAKKR